MILKLLLYFIFINSHTIESSNSITGELNDKSSIENEHAELIVVFENYNSKFHEEVLTQVNQINGLKIKGYCASLNCFYFDVDSIIFKSANDAFSVLEIKTKKFLPVYKEGTTSAMVVANCQRI